MAQVKVNGYSDDIIVVDGPGELRDEFYPDMDSPSYLAFSDGTLLRVEYTNGGVWIFTVQQGGTAEVSIKKNSGPDSTEYSDVVTLDGDISWCIVGKFISVE